MKKHDEGYVLAYVTVVLLLFCLIATMILTGAMKNLTIQQDTVQHMKDRYAAEGMIQQVIANNFIISEELKEAVLVCEEDGANRRLVVQSGTVQIICTVDSSGNYQTFEIGTVPTGEGS
jgi:Na+-transporting NADH:ubiquinone oxidoreductase subunit NqrC